MVSHAPSSSFPQYPGLMNQSFSHSLSMFGGVEIIGTVGVRHHLTEEVHVFGSFSNDNADAKLFRAGFTVKF